MRRSLFPLALVALAFGCGGPRPTSASPADEPRPSSTEAPASAVVPTADAGASPSATDASAEASLTADAGADAAPVARERPKWVSRHGKVWPFHAWDRAEAVTFNHFRMRPGVSFYAYDDDGESPHIVDRKPLALEQAKTAVELVTDTKGDVEVSKCPFPRHAVILYDRDTPVASINVCFECGDILLWPRWESGPVPANMTARQFDQYQVRIAKQMKLYEKTFPRWQAFFRDDVGFPVDARYH